MKLFSFGKDKEEKGNDKFPGATMLLNMKDTLMAYVAMGKKDKTEVSDYSVAFITNCNAGGMNPTFSVIGDQKDLIEMFYSAALEDEDFGKILVTAVEAAVFRSEELAELQKQLKSTGGRAASILGKGKRGSKKGMNLNDLENMSENDIIALAKKMAEDQDND